MFERVLTVDWSGRSKPSPVLACVDAIFSCYGDQSTVSHPIYHRTRQSAMDCIYAVVETAKDQKGTTLIGFDFSFGYPCGFAEYLTGSRDVRSLWRWLADRIQDDAQNANNRFQVAADINRMFPGVGPFWGAPANAQFVDLPHKGSQRQGHGLQEFRATEEGVKGAQSSWKLFTTGSVGSQALLGITRLHKLISRFPNIHLWPFDGAIPPSFNGVVLAEIYPSIINLDQDGLIRRFPNQTYHIKDAAQVRKSTEAFLKVRRADWDAAYPSDCLDDRVREEGWIAGISMSKGTLWLHHHH
jgi:molybdopterin molybdotransferase